MSAASRSIPVVVEQHAEEGAFLWLLRSQAVSRPHYDLKSLAELDARVEAHLDGLRVAGDGGWEVAEANLGIGEAGEVFVAALLALESERADRLEVAIGAGARPEAVAGLVSALGWAGWERARGVALELLRSDDPLRRAAGLRAYAVSRQHPGPALEAALQANEPLVASAAARTAAELGRVELLPTLEWYLQSDREAVKPWAAWAGTLLGSPKAAVALSSIAEQGGPRSDAMAATAARALPIPARRAWFDRLASKGQRRLAAIIAGAGGDPASVPWLLEAMADVEVTRAAGEAFTTITGADLAAQDLEGNAPEGFEEGPNDDPEDEVVELPPDSDLPWPDPGRIAAWWKQHGGAFGSGRYLWGKVIAPEGLQRALREAKQRQRLAAAQELKLLAPESVLVECRAPAR